jgi:HAD superfamily hydrolase (TIGR01509 family)
VGRLPGSSDDLVPAAPRTSVYAAVLFDMDGLMVDTEPIYRQAVRRAAGELGYEVSDEAYAGMVGKGPADSERALCEAMGPQFPVEQFRERYHVHRDACFTEMPIPVKPGLLELLEWLERQRIPRGVATSTYRKRAIPRLETVGLLRHFSSVTTSDQVNRGKPAPDLFLLAAESLGVRPQQCIVLEDSEAGILGAHAAGMLTVMVPDLVAPTVQARQAARWICASLAEAHEVLRGLLGSGPD